MSLSVALHNAMSGLQTNQAIVQVISNNITNASTEGYTRKSADPVSVTVALEGRGVEASVVSRVVDERVLADLRRNLSALGAARTEESYHQRVLDEFGTLADNTSLGASITDLSTAFQTMATSPESATHRASVITAAVELTRKLSDLSAQIQTLRADADKEIANKVTVLNSEIARIADLNEKIAAGQALGASTAELEDFRDQAMNTVSEMIQIQYFKRTTGEIVVALPDGQVLADQFAKTISHTPAGAMSPDITYAGGQISGILAGGVDLTTKIPSGEIKGLITARDTILPQLQEEIDLLAQKLRDELNTLHNAGTGLPPANTLTGTRTFSDASTNAITTTAAVRIAVVDAQGNYVKHFDLAAGTYTLAQIESQIDTNLSGAATASTSANGPLSITATNSANGIAIVDLGVQTVTHIDKKSTFSGFSNYFGLNDFFVTQGKVAGSASTGLGALIKVRDDLVSNPALLSRGVLDTTTSPTPVAGDPAIAHGDASTAVAMADKFLDELSFAATGALPQITASFAGYAAEILSASAVAASVAQDTAAFRSTLSEELSYRAQEVSGVNIDEELRNLVLYENAFAATARIIQVVDELFEQLVNIGR